VAQALTGEKPQHSRIRASWRGGDGYNVALDDSRGIWKDFATDEGGGVLDLVARVQGGTRQDALKWLADFVGVQLEDQQFTPADRERWTAERRGLERDLPAARYWRRGVLVLLEAVLDAEKTKLLGTTEAPADIFLIRDYTRIIERLKRSGDKALVLEYREWRTEMPEQCAGLVRWAMDTERAEIRALIRYLQLEACTA
jgi:hypothetical protein